MYVDKLNNINKQIMRKIIGLIVGFCFFNIVIYAQNITMDLGGQNHCGVYKTKPVKEFTKVLWKTKLDGYGGENIILKDDLIYTNGGKGYRSDTSRKGFIFAIDAQLGSIIWKDSINRYVSTSTLKDSILYIGSDDIDSKIRALNRFNGKLLWQFPLVKNACWPPALNKDKAFFGDHNGDWYVVNNLTGKELYKKNINAGICCVPSIVDGIVYYMDLKGALHSFNADNYSDSIIYETGAGLNNPPVIVDNVAYIVNGAGFLYAVDLKTKQLIWTNKIDDTMYRSPSVSDNVLTVITSHQHIYAFDKFTGKVLWVSDKTGLGYTNTAIAENIVYVGSADNYLYALDLLTGKEIWKFGAESPVNTPLINNGTVYFTSGNYIYAIQ
jgi:outer membrane protein assembly factor BamB